MTRRKGKVNVAPNQPAGTQAVSGQQDIDGNTDAAAKTGGQKSESGFVETAGDTATENVLDRRSDDDTAANSKAVERDGKELEENENASEPANSPAPEGEEKSEEPVILTGTATDSGQEDGAGDDTDGKASTEDPTTTDGEADSAANGDPWNNAGEKPAADEAETTATGQVGDVRASGDNISKLGETSSALDLDGPLNKDDPIAVAAYRAGVVSAVGMSGNMVGEEESHWLSLGKRAPLDAEITKLANFVTRQKEVTGEVIYIEASRQKYHDGPQQGFKDQPANLRAAFLSFVATVRLLQALQDEEDDRIRAEHDARQPVAKVPLSETMLEPID